jgi:prepilin-type N-terminal cleavage/methylation domain-containing protein
MIVPRCHCALQRRRGFSLIELVVVLMIIAIVAGLTVSIVGWLRRSADKGTASNVMASLVQNVELYRVTLGSSPDRFDSLIGSGSNKKLATMTLTAGQLTSLTKIGIANVMDHVAGSGVEGAPGLSGTALRALASGGTVATFDSATTNGQRCIASVYPTGVPTGVNLVVFGFGPGNTAIGKTIVSPPAYSGVGDPATIYDRYLCVFAVYDDGKRAQLKAVMDTTGDFLYQELAEFWDNKPE